MARAAFPPAPLAPPIAPEPSRRHARSRWVAEKYVWDPKRKLFQWVVGHFEQETDPPQVTADGLKLLYEHNCDQFKFYLTWRQLMFAGYFAVFSALALGFRWTLQNSPAYSCICPFLGALVSFVFWALDHRNLQLYEIVGDGSVAIEQALGGSQFGYFSVYRQRSLSSEKNEDKSPQSGRGGRPRHPPKLLTHRWILTLFYGLGGIVMLAAGILSAIHPLTISVLSKSEVAPRLVALLGWL